MTTAASPNYAGYFFHKNALFVLTKKQYSTVLAVISFIYIG